MSADSLVEAVNHAFVSFKIVLPHTIVDFSFSPLKVPSKKTSRVAIYVAGIERSAFGQGHDWLKQSFITLRPSDNAMLAGTQNASILKGCHSKLSTKLSW